MKIRIYCVGKVKERFFRDAAAEYQKRLSRYAAVEICEVADEKAPEELSEAGRLAVLKREGERILSRVSEREYVSALAIEGKAFSSEAFAKWIETRMVSGNSSLSFVIGGSLGLSEGVLRRSQEKISFSQMTFPHQLMRIILLEQIYRAFRILNHEPYHK